MAGTPEAPQPGPSMIQQALPTRPSSKIGDEPTTGISQPQTFTPRVLTPNLLRILCPMILCLIWALGLWPFHAPPNNVTWLKNEHAIALGKYGSAFTLSEIGPGVPAGVSWSIEIWVQPAGWRNSSTMLSLYAPSRSLVQLRQSWTDLEIAADIQTDPGVHGRAYFDDVLRPALQQGRPMLIAVTFDSHGTRVFLDGAPARGGPRFSIPSRVLPARLILGDSPVHPDSFRGKIYGLAIYGSELSAAAARSHYEGWKNSGQPRTAPSDLPLALYTFSAAPGDVIANRWPGGAGLNVPHSYSVIDKAVLAPLWKEFSFSSEYWKGNLKNIVGFVPFGFLFYGLLALTRSPGRSALLAVILGALVSLTIELLQAFLPSRDSGMTDLVTNSAGTYLGVVCYRTVSSLARRIPLTPFRAGVHR